MWLKHRPYVADVKTNVAFSRSLTFPNSRVMEIDKCERIENMSNGCPYARIKGNGFRMKERKLTDIKVIRATISSLYTLTLTRP